MMNLGYARAARRSSEALPHKAQRRIFSFTLLVGDIVTLGIAFALAYELHLYLSLEVFDTQAVTPDHYLRLMLAIVPGLIFLFHVFHLYDLRYLLGGTQEYARVLNTCTLAMMLLALGAFLTKIIVARGWLVVFWVLSVLLVGIFRFGMRRLAYALRHRGFLRTSALIVGADAEGRAIASQLKSTPTCGADILGFVDDHYAAGTRIDGLTVLGPVASICNVARCEAAEEILLSTTALTRSQILDIYQTLGASNGTEIRLSPGLFEILTTGARVREWGYVPLVSINKVRLNEVESWVKTGVDYIVAILALVVLAPFLVFLAAMIKWSSSGPILHRRRVLGRGGCEFDALKFRTMYLNGDEILAHHPELQAELQEKKKLKNDPRVTPVGCFLRKYSLDELPQLFNVLTGQMSLVGPRMITPGEAQKYGKWKLNLLTVKPGITGLWQVSGRSDISYDERVRLDMHYIRNYTFWLDLMILLRTIPVVLQGRGAY